MFSLRFCLSCSGPRPLAAARCPWCQRSYDTMRGYPEHLYGPLRGEKKPSKMLAPVD